MDYSLLSKEAADWVKLYMEEHHSAILLFHDQTHTQEVVAAAKKMAIYYKLDEKETSIVTIAAYFHDLGYFSGERLDHELRGAELAAKYLHENGCDEVFIEKVKSCILATKIPQHPVSLLEKIVCDADLFHFGSDDFAERNKLMRKEASLCSHTEINKGQWRQNTIQLLENHHFQTEYGVKYLEDQKQKNIRKLKEKMDAQATVKENLNDKPEAEKKDKKKKDKDNKLKQPERGVETMFRTTSANNQRLSDMADNKAHILITVNSIILSAVIALLLRKLDSNEHLIVPTFILLAVSLITMVIAILATRPSIPDGKFVPGEVAKNKVNLLFFGNFYRMELEQYTQGMLEVMGERDLLYGTLIKDVYSQGVVLGRKYRLLRLSYNIFMFGLIISVLAYFIVTLIFM
ncbi:HD domain-containing protein [bacterium A37T11]|nr:HD domain-containing protein [bacterium A37T11]